MAMGAMGVLGFWRFSTLDEPDKYPPRRTSLPARLLAALKKVERMAANTGARRLNHMDILVCFFLAVLLFGWTMINSFFPSYPENLQDLRISLEKFWEALGQENGSETHINAPLFFRQIAFLFCTGIAGFLAHSYAYKPEHVRQAALILLPVLCLGTALLLVRYGTVEHASYPAFFHARGAGTGSVDMLVSISPELKEGGSTLWTRLVEQGVTGVLLVYALFVPAAFSLLRFFVQRPDRRLIALCGLICLLILFLIDSFWLHTAYTQSLFFCGIVMICLCWGHAGFQYPREKPLT